MKLVKTLLLPLLVTFATLEEIHCSSGATLILFLFQLIVPFTDDAPLSDLTYGSHLSRYSFSCPSIYPSACPAFLPADSFCAQPLFGAHSRPTTTTTVKSAAPSLLCCSLLISRKAYYICCCCCDGGRYAMMIYNKQQQLSSRGGLCRRRTITDTVSDMYVYVRICWAGNPERQKELFHVLPNYVILLDSVGGNSPFPSSLWQTCSNFYR